MRRTATVPGVLRAQVSLFSQFSKRLIHCEVSHRILCCQLLPMKLGRHNSILVQRQLTVLARSQGSPQEIWSHCSSPRVNVKYYATLLFLPSPLKDLLRHSKQQVTENACCPKSQGQFAKMSQLYPQQEPFLLLF